MQSIRGPAFRPFYKQPPRPRPQQKDVMAHDIARNIYRTSVVSTANSKGVLPPAPVHSPRSSRSAHATPKPLSSPEPSDDGGLADLLNAIAALCVCEPQHQRVAVSLVHTKDRIVIHVAQSAGGSADRSIAEMVREVWRLLVDFEHAIGDTKARSSKAKARGHESQRRILERLVRHGIERLRHRVCKHWELLQTTCIRLQTEKVKQGRMYKDFCAVALRLAELREALLVPTSPADWGAHIAPLLGRFYIAEQKSSVRGLDNMRLFLDQLHMSTDESHELATHLNKYISKCAALVDNANRVMRLASYRAHSPIFLTPHFDIKTVPCRWERQPRAGSLSLWKSLLRKDKQDEALVQYRLHPECALLEHHHNTLRPHHGYAATPDVPSHLIGTSKDPCYACRIFFSTYHSAYPDKPRQPHHPLHLHLSPVQGTTSPAKVDSWLPPRLEGLGADVESKFASRLLEEYRQYRLWTREDIPVAVS